MANDDQPDKPLAPGLYLVATPIGNLEDITLRALRVLRTCDRIACEDTRQTQKLLNHFQITTPTVSYHQHNEAARTEQLITELKSGARIAVVSDAGTPGIADPGAEIASAAIAAGILVFPIPGANAALSALIASGLLGAESAAGSQGKDSAAFTFHGFLPAKEGQRRTALESLAQSATDAIHIFYEAPHRIVATLADIEAVFGPAQHIVLARELTKLHEEFLRGAVSDVRKTLTVRSSIKGEFVLLLKIGCPIRTRTEPVLSEAEGRMGGEAAVEDGATPQLSLAPVSIASAVRALMQSEKLSEMDALKRVARARGLSKSAAYREWQRAKSAK
ncbi:MAG TPA: 16S rRNA (cytidine(1402)-2'-O)-methyltransferase [Acidobacteriaceae bacterium]|nr:16S rRNA (cytidine(1402)-2'-O)-methyltransferase [Acidobacteriaceae bacterium]